MGLSLETEKVDSTSTRRSVSHPAKGMALVVAASVLAGDPGLENQRLPLPRLETFSELTKKEEVLGGLGEGGEGEAAQISPK